LTGKNIISSKRIKNQEKAALKSGNLMISPPLMADSCARIPTDVQLADSQAFGKGSLDSIKAIKNSWAKCG
jgi:hypothetical protein